MIDYQLVTVWVALTLACLAFWALVVWAVGEGPQRNGERYWLCVCDCGAEKGIRVCHLQSGRARSCGCLSAELSAARVNHGGARRGAEHPLYNTWTNMHHRCENPELPYFEYYGGRGIRVCERWSGRDGFANFIADMGAKPGPSWTIDRVDNDGPYAPENCRWATKAEQSANQRPRRRKG